MTCNNLEDAQKIAAERGLTIKERPPVFYQPNFDTAFLELPNVEGGYQPDFGPGFLGIPDVEGVYQDIANQIRVEEDRRVFAYLTQLFERNEMQHVLESFVQKTETHGLLPIRNERVKDFKDCLPALLEGFKSIEAWSNGPVGWILLSPDTLACLNAQEGWQRFYTEVAGSPRCEGVFLGAEVFISDLPEHQGYLIASGAEDLPGNKIEGYHFVVINFPQIVASMATHKGFTALDIRGEWTLVQQESTGDEKWVHRDAIGLEGIEVAFYDADPLWVPPAT